MQKKLYRTVYLKAGQIRNQIVKSYNGKTPQIKDFPATVVSCCGKNNFSIHEEEYSRICGRYQYVIGLESILLTLGKIGGKSKIKTCKNLVGHCAEPHAANEVLKKNPKISINDLVFSKAIRPRTLSIVAYCDNCKQTFNL